MGLKGLNWYQKPQIFGFIMKKRFMKDSLFFTRSVFQIVCLLIFGFKELSYDRIQTTLKQLDGMDM